MQGGVGERLNQGLSGELGWQGDLSAALGRSFSWQVQGTKNGLGLSADLPKAPKVIQGFGLGAAASVGIGGTGSLSFRSDSVATWEQAYFEVQKAINDMMLTRPQY